MNDELKQEMQGDIDLAKKMTDITSPEDVLELTNKLIFYLDMVTQSIAELDYKSDQLKGKQKILLEFIRSGKQFATNLSINRSQQERKY